MHDSKYVTNTPTWGRCWLQSSSVHPIDEDEEAHWLQNSWRKDAVASTKGIDELGQLLSPATQCMKGCSDSSCDSL